MFTSKSKWSKRLLPQWRPDIASADYQMAQIAKLWGWMLLFMLGIPLLVLLILKLIGYSL